ncbi:MAG: cytochrome c oxidase assembly protein [Deltaproteobacteria bacterium]|nr:cytochrome c oxidase assembly protein [Deltaproteobacteria bacterium]
MKLSRVRKGLRGRAGWTTAAAIVCALCAGVSGARAEENTAPLRDLVSRYLKAVYAQDYADAYRYVSRRDREVKSEAAYLKENPSFTGTAAELTRRLADRIEVGPVSAEVRGDSASVRFPVSLPDANSAELQELFSGFDPEVLNRLTPEKRRGILASLNEMGRTGRLPTITGEESLELLRENDRWAIFENWAEAVKVFFHAEVKEGLPWAFEPLQEMVLAPPGETLHAAYRARNLSERAVTGKARHVDTPKEAAEEHLSIIQCFCFLRETLKPGQEKELPLVFRVGWDVPRETREFHVTYQFYPSERFPDAAGQVVAQAAGTLEVRVKDHRDAIDDFRSVELRFGRLRLAPNARMRSTDPGWLELAPQLDRMDLTRYKDGSAAATVYRGALPPGRFAAVDLQVTDIRGILRKTGAPDKIKNAVGPIRLGFEIKPATATVVILDLELLDLSDHPGRGYELLIKGYELYENDRLLQKIPPG